MKLLLNVFFWGLMSHFCIAQNSVPNGDSLREDGKLEAAITAYKKTYHTSPQNWKNTYNLSCAYALTYQKDSAYHYLNIALKNDTTLWALADSDLYALIDDTRWEEMEANQLKKYQENKGKLQQPDYAKQLLRIIIKDQALDYYIKQARGQYMAQGFAPLWYYPLGAYKKQIGDDNYHVMKQLIKEYGWPTYSKVGNLAADALLLVINHHEDDAVRKLYIDEIKQSCLEGEGSCMEYAKIQDRILVNDGKLQWYGMQFRYTPERTLEPFPIKDPEYVDKRRKEIGLEPLHEYLKRKINYNWTVNQKK